MSDRRERLETERSVAEAEPKGTSYEVKDKRLSHPRWTVTGDVSSVSRPFSRLGSIPPRSYITRLI